MGKYTPVVIGCCQSQYGYWVVTVSVSPGKLASVMIVSVGVAPDTAVAAALTSVTSLNLTGR